MLEIAGLVDRSSPFAVTARPNSVVRCSGLLVAMLILVPVCSVLGFAFLLIGAWPVTVCLALHIAALLTAFLYVEKHAGDFERLTLADDRLILDTHTVDGDQHQEFNGYWVQVELLKTAVGGGNSLYLRSHGKEIPFGRLLSDEERCAVNQELCRRLAMLRH